MSTSTAINYEGVEEYDLAKYCEEAYLNYALYVIKDRVLPFVGDGLKPVQRRIIYTMAIEGINTSDKKKKSAYTVGQVLGRFHPHGDSACYESMVIMAQNFSYRYPMISGQGNFGDVFNPKGFAAMRYTESYLSGYSAALLTELNSGNVEWIPNYNGDEKEPRYLPARIPNIILNGTTGIAVGMATDIPPHNINEVLDACCALIDNPDLTVRDLMQYVKGPDYPTGAEIINSEAQLLEVYTTGRGSIRQRAVWHKDKDQIIITQLPYQAASTIIPKIAELIQAKKVINIEDIRDDSSETETRIVLQLKSSRTDADYIMNTLFLQTDLEKSIRVNFNMIGINGKPAVKDLKTILVEWIAFRKDIIRQRFEARLARLEVELNRILGFLIAFNNLDRVIEIVRNEEKPKDVLISELGLNEEQATAVLDLRIKNLAKLEEDALRRQEKALQSEKKKINAILSSQSKFNAQVKAELEQAKEEFGQERVTPIVFREPIQPIEVQEDVSTDPVFVVLSKQGWIRCGKGHDFNLDNLSYRNGDEYLTHCVGFANEPILFFDDTGRTYTLSASVLPSMRGYGESLATMLKLKDNVRIIGMLMTANQEQKVLFVSSSGHGHVTKVADLISTRVGKVVFNLKDKATLFDPVLLPIATEEQKEVLDQVTLIATTGHILSCAIADIPERSKGMGVKLIDINGANFEAGKDYLLKVFLSNAQTSLKIKNGSRAATIEATKLKTTRSERGNKGKVLIKGLTPKVQLDVINP